ncbi:restriction endonuclease subunit S [Acinetobacter towneri]|jgi:type I restriction enzyme S subunit|uniref:restriction endonuclease subunit S n=1 Tax=Acinetobacter towneri TaxID=202956 RepID=UPI003213E1AC
MVAPKLRFKEFNNDWSLKKLGDLSFKPQYGMNSSATEFDGENKYLRITDINEDDHSFNFSKLTSPADDLDDKYLLKNGDLLFARTGASVGKSYLYNSKDGKVYFAGFLIKFSLQTEVNPYFIFSQTLSKKFQNWVITNSMRSGQPGINAEEYSLLPISFTSLKEQTKIATFLSAVDEKISQLSQKLHLLVQYKQGMMQKLFSQQLRFKADDGSEFGEWSNKTIGDVANIKRGASPRPINDSKWFDDSSSIGWVRISDVSKSKKYLLQTEQYLSTLGIQKSRLVPKGNLIMSICATIGKPIYTGFDVCIHDGFVVFSELQAIHEYAYYYLEYIEKNWYQYGQPGTQVNLNSDIVSNEAFPFPCLEEQTKIANFLSAIDQKIDVVSEQLEQAKLWKKGLLQQMFV